MSNEINIELVYGLPHTQTLLSLAVEKGISVAQVIINSKINLTHPEIDLDVNKVGIWNKSCKLQDIVKDGDRIEIYRPLIADPKEVRKRRAEKAIEEGRADKVTGGRPQTRKK